MSEEIQNEINNENTGEEKKNETPDINKIIIARVKQEQAAFAKKEAEKEAEFQRREAAYQKRIDELEGKHSSKSKKSEEGEKYDPQKHISIEQLPELINMDRQNVENTKKMENFQKKIGEAVEKDQEFKKLVAESPQYLSPDQVMSTSHLPNAPDVLKHMLKDPRDYQLLQAAAQTSQAEMIRVLNEVSMKLEQRRNMPRPSEYEHIPQMGDGEGDDFDLDDYLKGKN